jgi:hypothetical protein
VTFFSLRARRCIHPEPGISTFCGVGIWGVGWGPPPCIFANACHLQRATCTLAVPARSIFWQGDSSGQHLPQKRGFIACSMQVVGALCNACSSICPSSTVPSECWQRPTRQQHMAPAVLRPDSNAPHSNLAHTPEARPLQRLCTMLFRLLWQFLAKVSPGVHTCKLFMRLQRFQKLLGCVLQGTLPTWVRCYNGRQPI